MVLDAPGAQTIAESMAYLDTVGPKASIIICILGALGFGSLLCVCDSGRSDQDTLSTEKTPSVKITCSVVHPACLYVSMHYTSMYSSCYGHTTSEHSGQARAECEQTGKFFGWSPAR